MHIGWWNEWEAGTPELSGRWEKENRNRWDVPRSQPIQQPSSNFRNLRSWMALSKPAHQLIFFFFAFLVLQVFFPILLQRDCSVFSVWCWMSGRIRRPHRKPCLESCDLTPIFKVTHVLARSQRSVKFCDIVNLNSTSHHHNRVLLKRVPPAIGETLNCVNCS